MNDYKGFFEHLKSYIVELDLHRNLGEVEGCTDKEIQGLEANFGSLPLAYKEFLKKIGKTNLSSFFDAESIGYEDLDYIQEFKEEVFSENNFEPKKPLFVFSERRNEIISFFYLNKNENPQVWIMSLFWDEDKNGENIAVRYENFTDMFIHFFEFILNHHHFDFNFVPASVDDKESYVNNKYADWVERLKNKYKKISEKKKSNNLHINRLDNYFMEYFQFNDVANISFEEKISVEKKPNEMDVLTYRKEYKKMSDTNFGLLNWFRRHLF